MKHAKLQKSYSMDDHVIFPDDWQTFQVSVNPDVLKNYNELTG